MYGKLAAQLNSLSRDNHYGPYGFIGDFPVRNFIMKGGKYIIILNLFLSNM